MQALYVYVFGVFTNKMVYISTHLNRPQLVELSLFFYIYISLRRHTYTLGTPLSSFILFGFSFSLSALNLLYIVVKSKDPIGL